MKRFTQYLYEYQKEKRVRNIGFVKAEQKEASCVLQIQGRGLEVKADEELKVYLFYKMENGFEAVYQGAIPKKKPIVSCTLEFTQEDIGNADSVEDILGLMLLEPGGKRYAAVWSGETVDVDAILTEPMPKVPAASELPEKPEVGEEVVETCEEVEPEVVGTCEEIEPEAVGTCEEPKSKDFCEKIQRKDLARLPRRDWRLANNNFLLHGFYNYHHLLWIEEGGELYIGVPGVNHAREVQAAKAFGFTQFRHAADTRVELTEEESNPREDFGYFCRRIARNE